MKKHLLRLFPAAAMMATLVVFVPVSSAYAAGLFGYIEIKSDRIESIPKWVEVLKRIHAEQPILEGCLADRKACLNGDMRDWADMVKDEAKDDLQGQLDEVNTFFNRFRYITDEHLYGVPDYWATPREFLLNSGDCEDFAIAKYFTLRALGWPDRKLRLVVVQDTVRDIPHAVLSVQMGTTAAPEFMILDNLTKAPLSDKYMMQYTPYYAVNESTRWIFIKPMAGTP